MESKSKSRRQTLGPLSSGQMNKRQSIGGARRHSLKPSMKSKSKRRVSMMPTTSKRSTSSSRQSLGGRRMSVGVSKRSTKSGRRSSIKGRRSSVYGKSGKIQDPRPIGDKAYQNQNIRTLITYLTTHFYDRAISPKLLTAPTKKDFQHIMCFLLKQVDPNFEFGANFEDEVKFYFKSFGYPYSISKSSLQAVGTPHTWPALLAALVWFIEFLTYDEEVKSNPEVTGLDTVNGDKFFFDYAAEAYNIFLHGGDTYDSLDQHLADTFDAKNQSVNEEISYFKQTNQNLKTQISTMKNGQSELVSLETKKTTAEADLQKFKHLNTQLTEHVEQLQKKFDSIKSEHQQKQIELKELAEEKTKLEDQLDKQELSHFEVQSMTHRRCMLEESLASLDEQKQKIQADIWDIEMKMCKSIAQVESNIHEFNALGVKLHMIPSSAKFAGGEDYELTFNPHKETLHEMLNIDLKVVVKPTLLALKRRLGDRVVEKQLKSRDLCEHLKQSNEFKIDEKRRVDELEQRLAKAEDSFVQEREITMSEMRGSYEKLEEQEMDIKRMEAGQTHMLKESERSLQKMDQKLEDIKDLYDQEIESFNNEICEAMDMLTAHKVHVSTLLEQLESQTVQVLEDVQAE